MNILVLGGGGREHAISWALAKSPRCTELYVAPGNGGTANIARNVKDLNAEDAQAVLAFAQAHNIELVVIGPEAPLVAGVAEDLFQALHGCKRYTYGTLPELHRRRFCSRILRRAGRPIGR